MESPNIQNESQGDRSKQIESLLVQADKLIDSGAYDVALDVIRRAQSLDTGNRFAQAFVGRIQRLMGARKARGGGGTPKPGSQYAPRQKSAGAPSTNASQRSPGGEGRQAAIRTAVEGFLSRAREYSAAKNFERGLAEIERARLLDPLGGGIDALEAEIRKEMEAERARMSEGQVRQQHEDEARKRELLEQELERIRKEKEEKRLREEKARKVAQQERLQQYLQSAEELIAGGRLDEAANQLAFVVVIEPLNPAAADLQRKIREIQERRRQEEIELRRRKEEEEQQRQAAVQLAIQKNIESANGFAGEKKFNDALRVITRAYMLDPLNEEVRACEQRILEAQEDAYRVAEAERRATEEAARRQQEEELRRLTEVERERLLQEQEDAIALEKAADKEKVLRHLGRAREHIARRSYHDALAEVAQAFAVDPFDEEIQKVEQEVMAAQRQDNSATAAQDTRPSELATSEETSDQHLGEHLNAARKLRSEGELARALDELTKAFALDPLNAEVRALEVEIESQVHGTMPPTTVAEPPAPAAPTPSPEKKSAESKRVTYHLNQARRHMEAGSYEDALAEVALGLTIDPKNVELRQMEALIWEFRNAGELKEANGPSAEENERLIRIHLAAAEQFQSKGEFGRALDEIAKAYQVDPLNPEIKKRENLIRQEELRRNHPDETPLKLVYPKKGAAGG
jgi:hypothetical protein